MIKRICAWLLITALLTSLGSAVAAGAQHHIPWDFNVYQYPDFQWTPVTQFGPQTVTILERRVGNWALIPTYQGPLWISLFPRYEAASVMVMDAYTGQILYGHEAHTLRFPASITKVMTALLVLELVEDLSETLRFSVHVIETLPSYASNMRMTSEDTLTIYEALYGIMLTSANEVARALGEHISGNNDDFVNLMNHRAWELGAVNTRFINPCGLPGEGQHTTAYDIALIMQAALRHPLFVKIINTPTYDVPPTVNHPEGREIHNTNQLIQAESDFHSPFVIGGKTGFTRAAGHTLVTYSRVNGRGVITSVLYAPERSFIFTDTAALLAFISFLP